MEQRAQRLVFLDLLRLMAAFQMIQGHAIDAVLAPSYRSGLAFAVWSFLRGLTSVLFLFSAGYSFALAEARSGSSPQRVRRALLLIVLGYLMHAPFALLLGAPREATLRAALEVDVLQCIGVSLLALELLAWRWPGVRARLRISSVGALVLLEFARLSASLEVDGPLRPLTNYLSTDGGSLFPLLPWTGYVLAGFALGTLGRAAPHQIPRTLAAFGWAALGLGGLQLWLLADPLALSPGYCLVKLACVALLAAVLARARVRPLSPWLTRLAGETLFLYVSHVVLLYADVVGLQARCGRRHSPWVGLGLAALLMLACSAGALGWRSLRGPRQGGTRAPQTT
jgi:uncharacterized membrane protein